MTEHEIIERLRMERKNKQLKQYEVIDRTVRNGTRLLNVSNLSMYERHVTMPGVDKVVIWAEALGMELTLVPKKKRGKNGETAEG